MSLPQLSLKGRALRLLSGREHSRAELERKLKAYEEEPGTLSSTLDELQTKGFISEQRVIESVLNRRAAKLGTTRIGQELQGKGLDPDAVSDALASLKATEVERARRSDRRNSEPLQPTPRRLRVRCAFWPRAVLALTPSGAPSKA